MNDKTFSAVSRASHPRARPPRGIEPWGAVGGGAIRAAACPLLTPSGESKEWFAPGARGRAKKVDESTGSHEAVFHVVAPPCGDDRELLDGPDGFFGNAKVTAHAALYPDGFSCQRFVQIIETESDCDGG